MSKKLKKKIEDLCGLSGLDWEARQERAAQILASPEWKQSICNDLIGLSFRELERTLSSVASERQKKEDSYEHKLATYKKGANKRSSSNVDRPKSRTLSEILAQVYAPRVVQVLPKEELRRLFHDRATDGSSDEIQPNAADEHNCPEESMG